MDRTMSTFLVLHTPVTCAERFGDLHSERAYASRRTINQDLLSWLNMSLVAKPLQCGECRHRYRGCLLKRHVFGFMTNADSGAHA